MDENTFIDSNGAEHPLSAIDKATVREIAPATVRMVRPEDQQPEPCVAEVPEGKVAEWEAAGWKLKA